MRRNDSAAQSALVAFFACARCLQPRARQSALPFVRRWRAGGPPARLGPRRRRCGERLYPEQVPRLAMDGGVISKMPPSIIIS
jgi:hypothetical protein